VSGDMLVGALIDLGADFDRMKETLSDIAEISIRDVKKAGIRAKKFDAEFDSDSRNYIELIDDIEKLNIAEPVRILSTKILHGLARAESRVHNAPIERVHLHEASDCIVDAVAFSLALEDLNLLNSRISCSTVSIGRTAPATEEIITMNSIPTEFLINEEIATPTGVAILASVANRFNNSPLNGRTGHGAGAMDLTHPNVLRATLLQLKPCSNLNPAVLSSDIPYTFSLKYSSQGIK